MSAIQVLLKLPWTHFLLFEKPSSLLKSKCLSVGIWTKFGAVLRVESGFDIFNMSLFDGFEQVRAFTVISMPLIAIFSGLGALPHIFRRLE